MGIYYVQIALAIKPTLSQDLTQTMSMKTTAFWTLCSATYRKLVSMEISRLCQILFHRLPVFCVLAIPYLFIGSPYFDLLYS